MSKPMRWGAVAVLLMPLATLAADELRMVAEGTGQVGMVSEFGQEQARAQLSAVEAHLGTFQAAAWFAYAAAALVLPAVLVLWRLAVDRSPRWAWAGGVLGACLSFGEVVHLTGYYTATLVQLPALGVDPTATVMVAGDTSGFALATFVPFLLGEILALPVLAIALRRAGVLPTWALVTLLAGSLLFMVVGSQPVVTAVWAAASVVGFAPAALAAWQWRTGSTDVGRPVPGRSERRSVPAPLRRGTGAGVR